MAPAKIAWKWCGPSPRGATRSRCRFGASGGSKVFVPLDVARGVPDTDDVDATVAVDVGGDTAGGRHPTRVNHLVGPFTSWVGRRIHHVDRDALDASITSHDVIAAVAIEITHGHLVALGHLV